MISVLSFLMAASSFLAELNLAQTLSATLGGTALRFQTTFGLFTFSLGMGAWAYNFLSVKSSNKKILITSQVFLFLTHLASPYWILWFNPLEHFNSSLFALLSYFPILITGLLSGLELPALLNLEYIKNPNRFSALTWDYVGMFLVSIMYPIWLLYSYGVFKVSLLCSSLALMGLVLTLFLPNSCPPRPVIKDISRDKSSIGVLALIFIFSFCSFSYELLIAKSMGDVIGNDTLAYSAGIGVFLLGMSFGTWATKFCTDVINNLIQVEFSIIIFCSLQFFFLHLVATIMTSYTNLDFLSNSQWFVFCFLIPFPLLIGFLTGYELPLLLRLLQKNDAWGTPLALNYCGALVSGFAVPLVFIPNLNVSHSLQLVCCINLVAWAYLIWIHPKKKWTLILQSLIVLLVFGKIEKWNLFSEQIYLKSFYYQLKTSSLSLDALDQFYKVTKTIDPIQRTTTSYQHIDKVKNTYPLTLFKKENAAIYLNKQQQFDTGLWKTYHESFVIGSSLLHPAPIKKVLICGGGDGLLAATLLLHTEVESITIVELDPIMIQMAKEDSDFLAINDNAFNHPKVHVILDDAYKWISTNNTIYDAVFIDFPYPSSFELSRLYSLEFYSAVYKKITPSGFIVLDAPIWRYLDHERTSVPEQQILKDTLSAAGFKSIFIYGSIEPMIYASPEAKNLSFDYTLLPKNTSDRTFVNLISLDFLADSKTTSPQINSIYFPKKFLEND